MILASQKTIQGVLNSINIQLIFFLIVCQFARKSKECLAFGDFEQQDGVTDSNEIFVKSKFDPSGAYHQEKDFENTEVSTEPGLGEHSDSCRYFQSSKRLICNGSIDFAYLKDLKGEKIVDFIVEKYEMESTYRKKYWSRKTLETGEWYTKIPKVYQTLAGKIHLKEAGLEMYVVAKLLPRRDMKGFLIEGDVFSNTLVKISWSLKGNVFIECVNNKTIISLYVKGDDLRTDWGLKTNFTFTKRNTENETDEWKTFGLIKSDFLSKNQYVAYRGVVWTRIMKGECKFSGEIELPMVSLLGSLSGTVSPTGTRQITIPNSAFSDMTIKNIVFKDSNFYKDFDARAFEGLNGVESVTFVGSKLEAMPRLDEFFSSFSSLEEINIEECTTPSLKFGNQPFVKGVRRLSLKGSGPLNFDHASFIWLGNSSLTYLNLQNSHVKISTNTISVLWSVSHTLRHLDISHSTLGTEKDLKSILNGLNLFTLTAENLNLKNIPTLALSNVRNTLNYLSLRGNDFRKYLEKHMFDNILTFPLMLNLKELNLMDCHINYLEKGTFDPLPNLKILHLAFNNLENIQDGWTYMKPQIVYLDLSYNSFTPRIPSAVPYGPATEMNLTRFKELKTLNLSHGIFASINKLISTLGSSLQNLSLCNTGLEDLSENLFENLTNLEVLDLSYNRNLRIIQSLSFNVFRHLQSLRILDLNNCKITGADIARTNKDDNGYEDFYLENLEFLDLSVNNIKILDSNTFRVFPKLKFLNLHGNSITVWKTSLFLYNEYLQTVILDENKIETLTETMLIDIKRLQHVKVGNNPFICGSYVYEIIRIATKIAGDNTFRADTNFQAFMENNNEKEDFEENSSNFIWKLFSHLKENHRKYGKILDWSENNYVCFSWSQSKFIPFTLVNEEFEKLHEKKNDLMEATLMWLPIIVIAGVVLTVAIISWKFLNVHLITRAVRNAVALSFLSSGEKETLKYEYNIFVSYSDKDRTWVLENLLPRLESWNDVKVCLHERDFQVGLSIMENIIACIDSSRNIVLVLSKAFLKSQWCQYEMHMAQHRLLEKGRDQLILILLENIPPIKRPKTLKYLMMTKTYIQWPTNPKNGKEVDVFWNRLMKSLVSTQR